MKIAFINPNAAHDYDAGTPFEKALAGSESAQCYLSIELAKRGHEVYLFTGTRQSATRHGVHCSPVASVLDQAGLFDAAFVTSSPADLSRMLRTALGPDLPIFAWEHNHWIPDPRYSGYLQNPQSVNDYIVCVSEWHRSHFITAGNLDPTRVFVLRNAVAPFFEDLFSPTEDIIRSKMRPPVFAFTSTPYTGLEAAADFFRTLRKQNHAVTLNIYSSFDMYAPNNNNRMDPRWQNLYQSCRQLPGANYIGNVPQRTLARSLKSTLALFYPNVLAETSSICTMEAMAAGCVVITSALGALPETSAGFGEIVESRDGKTLPEDIFVERSLNLIKRFTDGDPALSQRLRQQVDFVNQHYRWSVRAAEVEVILQNVTGRAAVSTTGVDAGCR